MQARQTIILASMVLIAASAPLFAHHSFASTYFEDQRTTIQGTLVEFLYRSPHSFVTVEASDPKTQQPVRWTIEWASPTRLGREGVNPGTLRPGDQVTVLGHPGRKAEEHRLHMWGIARSSDGWKWGHAID